MEKTKKLKKQKKKIKYKIILNRRNIKKELIQT